MFPSVARSWRDPGAAQGRVLHTETYAPCPTLPMQGRQLEHRIVPKCWRYHPRQQQPGQDTNAASAQDPDDLGSVSGAPSQGVPFMLSLVLVSNSIIDYRTASGSKLFKGATASLPTLFDGKPEHHQGDNHGCPRQHTGNHVIHPYSPLVP